MNIPEEAWFKSTFSPNDSQCVEAAWVPGGAAFRDSKNPNGGTLLFDKDELRAFLLGVKDGQFDHLLED